MADKRPADKKPKGSGNPNRINRLLVKKASSEYGDLTNLIVLSNLGINSEQNQEIRQSLREKKFTFKMVRNRLTMKAFGDLGLKESDNLFKGPTCILNGADPVAAAKIGLELVEKYNKTIKLIGGLLEGKVLSAEDVKMLSKSKSKPELLGDVVGAMRGPGSRIAGALKGPGSRIAGAIKALAEKLEKAAAPAVEVAPAAEAVAVAAGE
ncbi:MAG: 50S ribosomal protein L10 [Planctomycetota bacterium]